ncbi:MAG: thioredoxin family protein [Bacteroidota bacterium]
MAVGYMTAVKFLEKMNRMISKKEFRKKILESNQLAVVQFKAEWSGVCQIISPVYEALAGAYTDRVKFFTIDVEKDPGLDDEYGVMELPTLLFFKNGNLIDHASGLIPKKIIIDKIEDALTDQLN